MIKVGLYTGAMYEQDSLLKVTVDGKEFPVVLYETCLDEEYYYMSDKYRLHIETDDRGMLYVKRGELVHPSEIIDLPDNVKVTVDIMNTLTYVSIPKEFGKDDYFSTDHHFYFFITSIRLE